MGFMIMLHSSVSCPVFIACHCRVFPPQCSSIPSAVQWPTFEGALKVARPHAKRIQNQRNKLGCFIRFHWENWGITGTGGKHQMASCTKKANLLFDIVNYSLPNLQPLLLLGSKVQSLLLKRNSYIPFRRFCIQLGSSCGLPPCFYISFFFFCARAYEYVDMYEIN